MYRYRARAFPGLKLYKMALRDYGEAIRLQPHWAATYYARGAVFQTMGRLDLAMGDYNMAIRLNPGQRLRADREILAPLLKRDKK